MLLKEMTIWDTVGLFLTDRYLARTTYHELLSPQRYQRAKSHSLCKYASEGPAHTVSDPHSVGNWLRLLPLHSVQDPAAKAGGHPESRHENPSWLYTRHIVWSHAPSTRPAEYAWTKQKKPKYKHIWRWAVISSTPSWKSRYRGALSSQDMDGVDEQSI